MTNPAVTLKENSNIFSLLEKTKFDELFIFSMLIHSFFLHNGMYNKAWYPLWNFIVWPLKEVVKLINGVNKSENGHGCKLNFVWPLLRKKDIIKKDSFFSAVSCKNAFILHY